MLGSGGLRSVSWGRGVGLGLGGLGSGGVRKVRGVGVGGVGVGKVIVVLTTKRPRMKSSSRQIVMYPWANG